MGTGARKLRRALVVTGSLALLVAGVLLLRSRPGGVAVEATGAHLATPSALADAAHRLKRQPATVPHTFILARVTATRTSAWQMFEAEPRDAAWAPRMEGNLLTRLAPALAAMPGASLGELTCHSSACRVTVDLTPELKRELNRANTGGDGAGFFMDIVLRQHSLLAPAWGFNSDHEGTVWERASHLLRLASVEEFLISYRRARLLHEELLLMFDENTHDPDAYPGAMSRLTAKVWARNREYAARER
jgi:hypothetical protein